MGALDSRLLTIYRIFERMSTPFSKKFFIASKLSKGGGVTGGKLSIPPVTPES
jgi:hypothetical protein